MVINNYISDDPLFIIIDLFCGFGGTTTGFLEAELNARKIAKVIACVNHDPKAIKSHWLNHLEVLHFEEDIRTLDLTKLAMHTKDQQARYPQAKLILWASLECTNFSKAKGGQARDADSRTLADHLERYVTILNPDYIKIENVVEFMSWGPLDDKGKPLSRKNGQDFIRWTNEICALGYRNEWKEMNSADFGAYTSRNRLFGCFAKESLPIVWPEATHSKKASTGMFGDLKKWMPVKEVLDFSDEGQSIFTRKKPLSDKTLERIYAGLIKYVAKGDKSFIQKYFSGKPEGKVITTDGPAGTICTVDTQALVQTSFISNYKSGNPEDKNHPVDVPLGTNTTIPTQALVQPEFLMASNGGTPSAKVFSTEDPCRVITTADNKALVQPQFIVQRNGGTPDGRIVDVDGPARTLTATGGNQDLVQPEFLLKYNSMSENGTHTPPSVNEPPPVVSCQGRLGLVQPICMLKYDSTDKTGKHFPPSLENPCPVIIAQARLGVISGEFMYNYYGNGFTSSTDVPSPTVTTADNKALVTPFIVNPSHGGHNTSTDAPCPVIIARQDKAPLSVVQLEHGKLIGINIFDTDPEIMIKIKQFMAVYQMVDIKMRMLRVPELLRIQGFPDTYQMVGNQSDHKKFIGNSVHPKVPKAWAEAMGMKLINKRKTVAA